MGHYLGMRVIYYEELLNNLHKLGLERQVFENQLKI